MVKQGKAIKATVGEPYPSDSLGVKAVMCGITLETEEHRRQILDGFKEEFGEDIKILGSYKTLPGQGGEGGRSDVVIELPSHIISRAAVHPWHLNGMFRWHDDFLAHSRGIVPREALEGLFNKKDYQEE